MRWPSSSASRRSVGKKLLLVLVAGGLIAGGAWYYRSGSTDAAASGGAGTNGGRAGGAPGGGPGMAGRAPMTVEVAPVTRGEILESITVVGNLIGAATIDVVPRVAGRIESVSVKLGDRVARGQVVAKIEDREINEQINQATATLDVNKANVIQRQNDVQVQQNALDRTRNSYERGLTAKQLLEDAEARHTAAVSALNVAKAQQSQTEFRIDELKITLSNTTILSPIDGFVSRRNLDPGGFAGANTVIVQVVDLRTVRMVGNLVEKGFKRVTAGVSAVVSVDAFPGEDFEGQVSRVAPVFDPATRTAQMEIEVPNPGFRLKPGMYARVRLTVDRRPDALTVPRAAVVDTDGKRGVFLIQNNAAHFVDVQSGITDGERVEILTGLQEGQHVITTGALALREGDRVALPPTRGGGGRATGQGRGQ